MASYVGSSADDRLFGTVNDDSLFGQEGDDFLSGGAGNDRLSASDGHDVLLGGAGADILLGGAGDDTFGRISSFEILGQRDRLSGFADPVGAGDSVYGGAGRDVITVFFAGSTAPATLIDAGVDDDEVHLLGASHISVNAGSGHDLLRYEGLRQGTLQLGDGNDTLRAERQSFDWEGDLQDMPLSVGNQVDAGAGDDQLYLDGDGWQVNAGSGDDRIALILGSATVSGGLGRDSYVFSVETGWAGDGLLISDFAAGAGGDRLDLSYLLPAPVNGAEAAANPFGNGKLRLQNDGADCLLQRYRFGRWETLARLQGVSASQLTADNFVQGMHPQLPVQGSAVNGTAGGDSLSATFVADQLSGLDGNDTLLGQAGDDSLLGGLGDDWLVGGAGADRLLGDEGNDTFGLRDELAQATELTDGVDRLAGVYEQLRTPTGNGDMAWGGNGRDTFYLSLSDAAGARSASLYGGADDDRMFVEGGQFAAGNTLVLDGGSGHDLIQTGSGGSALVDGGTGNDTLSVHNTSASATDRPTVNGGDGDDRIDIGGYASVSGGAGNDVIQFTYGSGTISGGAGADTIAFGAYEIDDPEYYGPIASLVISDFQAGAGGDKLDLHFLLQQFSAGGIDFINNPFSLTDESWTYDLQFVDVGDRCELRYGQLTLLTLQGVSAAQLTADNFVGGIDPRLTAGLLPGATAAADSIRGGWADDTLKGVAGNDTLRGDVGRDRLEGGDGDDLLDGGFGNDVLFGGNGNDSLVSGLGQDSLYGGLGNDVLDGSRSNGWEQSAYLDGGSGSDTLIGSTRHDVFVVRDSDDLVLDAPPQRQWDYNKQAYVGFTDLDRVIAYASFNMQQRAEWAEHLEMRGTDALNAWGNDLDNTLKGNDAANRLYGGGGDDVLYGFKGNDTLIGGAGNDLMSGSYGSDSMVGGTGDDTYSLFADLPRLYSGGFGPAAQTDVINDYAVDGGVDKVVLEHDMDYRRLWLEKQGDDLCISVLNTKVKAVIDNWYKGDAWRVERFQLGYDRTLSADQIDVLVSAMASMGPKPSTQSLLSTDQLQQLHQALLAAPG